MPGMLDADFIEDDEDDFSAGNDQTSGRVDVSDKDDENESLLAGTQKGSPEKEAGLEAGAIDVEIVDDTPEEDKGRRVADPEKDDLGPSVEELKRFSKKDARRRLGELTEARHAERRRADELARQYSELQNFTKGLLQSNNSMAELIDNGEKILQNEHKQSLEARLGQAKNAYREAHEAGDPNGMVAAQENIAKLAAAIDRVSVYQPRPMPRQSEDAFNQKFTPVQAPPQIDEKTRNWVEKNPWFQNDQIMQGYAMVVHNSLVRSGVKPSDDAYFKAIDKEMRTRFPEKFNSSPRRTQTIVASAQREGTARPVTKVTLTESQVRIAKRLGLTPQLYAAEVLKQQRSG